jgi:hypothetical protein
MSAPQNAARAHQPAWDKLGTFIYGKCVERDSVDQGRMYHGEPPAAVRGNRSLAAYRGVASAPFICPRNWAIGPGQGSEKGRIRHAFGVTLLPYSASIHHRAGGPHGAAATIEPDIGALNTPV